MRQEKQTRFISVKTNCFADTAASKPPQFSRPSGRLNSDKPSQCFSHNRKTSLKSQDVPLRLYTQTAVNRLCAGQVPLQLPVWSAVFLCVAIVYPKASLKHVATLINSHTIHFPRVGRFGHTCCNRKGCFLSASNIFLLPPTSKSFAVAFTQI